jgi:YidC/Oxa1 family membrane protein insertase
MWQAFIDLMITILTAIKNVCGDWGIAVILLTVIVRLIITPFQTKSLTSSAKMQALQPKMQELQDKYQDDPEKLSAAMRDFYAENKFNPFGGCLPILVQMPIFFALYRALLTGIPQDATLLGLINLSVTPSGSISEFGFPTALVYILFDVGFGVLTLVPMLMNRQAGADANQQRQSTIMGVTMAIMMAFVGWNLVVGVLLYYVVSSLWGVVQQRVVTRHVLDKIKAEAEQKAVAEPVKVNVVRKERKARPHKKN